MLNIYFGIYEINTFDRYIWNMNSYFDNNYENYWINDEVSRQIIKDIDKSEVIKDKAIFNEIFGVQSPENLSGGTKLLITMNIEGNKNIYNGTNCGENCSDWILKIAEDKDIIITRNYKIEFSKDNFNVKCLNDNSIVCNNKDLFNKYLEFKDSGYEKYEKI